MAFKVGVIGCRFNTRRFIEGLIRDGIPIDTFITLDPSLNSQSVSGYENLVDFAESRGIDTYTCNQYGFSQQDRINIGQKRFDIIFCVGWQRLLPKWVLELSQLGVFGMHGSCWPLPEGRGRSPQVWSILLGATKYYAHIFRYDEGADDGLLLHVECFDITPFDTASCLQLKSQIVFNRVVKERWKEICSGQIELVAQPSRPPSWFEKRTPQDGLIRWDLPAQKIADFVRAQTRPYPGAFTFLGQERLTIWAAHVFDTQLVFDTPPGTIVDVFSEDCFLVQAGDYALRVTDFTGTVPGVAATFSSSD